MPKYIPVADKIADGLFAAKNRLFDLVQRKIDEGKTEKEVMKELKEGYTADPAVLSEIENVFFKKKAEIIEENQTSNITIVIAKDHFIQYPTKVSKFNPYKKAEKTKEETAGEKLDQYMTTFRQYIIEEKMDQNTFNSLSNIYDDLSAGANPVQVLKDTETFMSKKASWINDAKVGDQVELNGETGEITYIGSEKVEVKTPTKTETIWKN